MKYICYYIRIYFLSFEILSSSKSINISFENKNIYWNEYENHISLKYFQQFTHALPFLPINRISDSVKRIFIGCSLMRTALEVIMSVSSTNRSTLWMWMYICPVEFSYYYSVHNFSFPVQFKCVDYRGLAVWSV